MTKKLKIFLTGGWGYGNRGDNAILAGTLAAIDGLGVDYTLSMTSFSQSELKTKHGLASTPSMHALLNMRRPWGWMRWPFISLWRKTGTLLLPSLRRQFDDMKRADVIIFGGGGYFNDTWKEAFPARMVELEMAKASGRPYVILGQTIGPFSDHTARVILPPVLQSAAMVAYRDRQSGDVLDLAQVPGQRKAYTADMAHLIPQPAHVVQGVAGRKIRIGLMLQAFRQYEARAGLLPFGRIKSVEDYLRELMTLIERLAAEQDVQFVMIASTSWDEKFMRKVEAGMKQKGLDYEAPALEAAPVQSFIDACQSVDLMLSTNMHPVILASLAYIPTIALSYHFKLDDYMTRIGREAFCHRIDNFDIDSVVKQTEQILQAGEASREHLKQQVNAVVSDARKNLGLLKSVVQGVQSS